MRWPSDRLPCVQLYPLPCVYQFRLYPGDRQKVPPVCSVHHSPKKLASSPTETSGAKGSDGTKTPASMPGAWSHAPPLSSPPQSRYTVSGTHGSVGRRQRPEKENT